MFKDHKLALGLLIAYEGWSLFLGCFSGQNDKNYLGENIS